MYQVYKFGGASIKDADSIRNMANIISSATAEDMIIVVSAMGKTTNALERVTHALWNGDTDTATAETESIRAYHQHICEQLGVALPANLFDKLQKEKRGAIVKEDWKNYDNFYDQIVSYGELISSQIVYDYLLKRGIQAGKADATEYIKTDSTYRAANVDTERSAQALKELLNTHKQTHIWVTQGFIGSDMTGQRTTLGREGSDYTAALTGNFTDAESVTIWKDVQGVLSGDPRITSNTTFIPELSYFEAVELAYSGAQIIHPKTIRPLANKHIPLLVKPFKSPNSAGTIIHDTNKRVNIPVHIWRNNQVLITLRAKDFSFVLEESLSNIFNIINRNHLKVNLIQSSAVTISVCVDNTTYIEEAIEQLQNNYIVTYNEDMSLLTIRGTTEEILKETEEEHSIMLSQTTRRTARFVIKGQPKTIA